MWSSMDEHPRTDHFAVQIINNTIMRRGKAALNIHSRTGLYLYQCGFARNRGCTQEIGMLVILDGVIKIYNIIPPFHQFKGYSSFTQSAKLIPRLLIEDYLREND